MKVAFCASEVFPYVKTGGLADVTGSLPLALESLGLDVSIFVPRYKCVDEKQFSLEKINKDCLKAILGKNIDVYFIEHQEYFFRDGVYGYYADDYPDNLKRYQYFSEKTLQLIKRMKLAFDVVHCHDWHAALIPVYLKKKYAKDKFFQNTKTVLTIHNLAYQGVFPKTEFKVLGLDKESIMNNGFYFHDKINLLKAGILYSDVVTTVSSGYAAEIQSKEFGCGLEEVLRSRKDKVRGILNGLDYTVWNPRSDSYIKKNYMLEEYKEGKKINKAALQENLDLPVDEDVPVYGFVGRLAHQKGVDLILEALDDLSCLDIQIVIQGVGDDKYQEYLTEAKLRYPAKIGVCLEFDEQMAHQIYAGSDMFLMPSIFEPCGLSQMISLKYGTIPLVFKTGGLADTIQPFNSEAKEGNGFVFDIFKKDAFVEMIVESIDIYNNKETWDALIHNAFKSDFSWKKSALRYKDLYQCLQSD